VTPVTVVTALRLLPTSNIAAMDATLFRIADATEFAFCYFAKRTPYRPIEVGHNMLKSNEIYFSDAEPALH